MAEEVCVIVLKRKLSRLGNVVSVVVMGFWRIAEKGKRRRAECFDFTD